MPAAALESRFHFAHGGQEGQLEFASGESYPPPMRRRYAILQDNDELLDKRLEELRHALPPLVSDRVCAVAVIGSVAEGRARDGSDVDLLLILRAGTPSRGDYVWWDGAVASRLPPVGARFPLQPVFVGRTALATTEPNLRRALRSKLVLWDPEALFNDQSEARP